ncbi:hypothetical protein LPJ53_001081 [Coemansia erecta]|uniref:Myb-like domain-containing protein n=1 Tax=Coemansia erecta TaxID=147472 RepID=A0A9W7Y5P3_9FUNG|nr:hypothetical protein LPJ53_001081 [Coemansia erecta]
MAALLARFVRRGCEHWAMPRQSLVLRRHVSGAWGAAQQTEVKRLIDEAESSGVPGDWAAVRAHVLEVPMHHQMRWSDSEISRLTTHVDTTYLSHGLSVDWPAVGRLFERSSATCMAVYHTHKRPLAPVKPVRVEIPGLAQLVAKHSGDWDAVARAAGHPLAEVLGAALGQDALGERILADLPHLAFPGQWDAARRQKLREFMKHAGDQPAGDLIKMAAIYVGVAPTDCASAAAALDRQEQAACGVRMRATPWTDDETKLLCEARNAGHSWTQISAMLVGRSVSACSCRWRRLETSTPSSASTSSSISPSLSWTPEELAQLETMVEQSANVKAAERQFAHHRRADVRRQLARMRTRLSLRNLQQLARGHPDKLTEAVKEATGATSEEVDWRQVALAMQSTPGLCRKAYLDLCASRQKRSARWTENECEALRGAVEALGLGTPGFSWDVVARIVGDRRLPHQYAAKYANMMKRPS